MLFNNFVGSTNYAILNNSLGVLAFKCTICNEYLVNQYYIHNNRVFCKKCFFSTQVFYIHKQDINGNENNNSIQESINQIYKIDEPALIQGNVKCEDKKDPLFINNLPLKCEPKDKYLLEDSIETTSDTNEIAIINHKENDVLQSKPDPLYIKPELDCNQRNSVKRVSFDCRDVAVTDCGRSSRIHNKDNSSQDHHQNIGDDTIPLLIDEPSKVCSNIKTSTLCSSKNILTKTENISINILPNLNSSPRKFRSRNVTNPSIKQSRTVNLTKCTSANQLDNAVCNNDDRKQSLNAEIKQVSGITSQKFLYKCASCKYYSLTVADFNKHTQSKHTQLPTIPTVYKCNDCPYYATTSESLKLHVLSKHENARRVLLGIADGNSDMEGFIMKYLNMEKMYCLHCKFSTTYKDTLEDHMKKHKRSTSLIHFERDISRPAYRCHVCGQSYIKRSVVLRHIRSHTGEKRYCCTACGRCFSSSVHTKEHCNQHPRENTFVCNICYYTTNSSKCYKNHISDHSNTKLTCPNCSYETTRKSAYSLHIRKHTGEKPFKCKICPFRGASQAIVYHHSKQHSEKSLLKCLECNYTTYHKYNFDTHTKNHTGDGLMFCADCGYNTSHRGNLVQHLTNGCSKKYRRKK